MAALSSQADDDRNITPDIVESKIGISKEYNAFELRNALVEKDKLKAFRIVKYIDNNPKNASLYSFLPVVFSFFQNLMVAHYSPDKSERGVARALGMKSEWGARDYVKAMKNYSAMKTMQIIHEIRVTDAKSKGVENVNSSPGDLLKQLICYILE